MRLVDANLLLYAHVTVFPCHPAARSWLDDMLNGSAPFGLPWASLLAFVRLVTNPRVFEHPEPVADAWQQVEEWLDCPAAWIPLPTAKHREILGGLLAGTSSVKANLIPDAHLAALALEHGLLLCSTDGDFARFRQLRWENPLARD
jgi:toxin-antitoxin system PIN domain toxin